MNRKHYSLWEILWRPNLGWELEYLEDPIKQIQIKNKTKLCSCNTARARKKEQYKQLVYCVKYYVFLNMLFRMWQEAIENFYIQMTIYILADCTGT